MPLKLIILAGRKTGYDSIRHLATKSKHRIVGIITQNYPNCVNDSVFASDYATLARDYGIPFLETEKLLQDDVFAFAKELAPDIGLSIGWRRLVRDPFLCVPPLGFFNFHTSDLPKYRGFASTSWAIIKGEPTLAITCHKMMSGIADEGDIYLKKHIPITQSSDIASLFDEIIACIPEMVETFLDNMEAGHITPVPQDEASALLSYPRHPADGWIDWHDSAVAIDKLVRAVTRPYPGAITCWGLRKVLVFQGYAVPDHTPFVGIPGHVVGTRDGKSIDVLTGNGIYCITDAEVEEQDDTMPIAMVIRGVQQRLGLTQSQIFNHISELYKKGNLR